MIPSYARFGAPKELADLWNYARSPYGLRQDIAHDTYFRAFEGQSFARVRAMAACIAWTVRAAHCIFAGHVWVDDSYGGPESGAMAAHCDRCGYHFHTQLY